MPLSRQGLCEAETTTPAEKPCVCVRYAMAGVGTTPALAVSTPVSRSPQTSSSAIHPLDSRVSCPMTTRRGPAGRWSPSARPTAYTVFLSSGYSPATPRMPSVPKSFLKSAPWYWFYHRGHREHRDAPEFPSVPLRPLWLIVPGRFHFRGKTASRHARGDLRAIGKFGC